MKNRLLLILCASFLTGICTAQTHKTYSGTYPDGRNDSHKGKATYSYREDELGQRIYDGPCTFSINVIGPETAKG